MNSNLNPCGIDPVLMRYFCIIFNLRMAIYSQQAKLIFISMIISRQINWMKARKFLCFTAQHFDFLSLSDVSLVRGDPVKIFVCLLGKSSQRMNFSISYNSVLSLKNLLNFSSEIRPLKVYLLFQIRYFSEIFWRHAWDVCTLFPNNYIFCMSVSLLVGLLHY